MSVSRFLDLLFATDPRRSVRFPDLPIEQALAEWETWKLNQLSAATAAAAESPATKETSASAEEVGTALCSLATHLWRAKNKMIESGTGEPKEEMKRAYRHVESAYEVFKQLGLTLNDWQDQPYDAGLPVKVLSFQPMPGLTRDTVLEVVRPTVIWKDRLLQLGEVIVGIPANSDVTK